MSAFASVNVEMPTFSQLLEKRALDSKDKVFCQFEEQKITFGELAERVSAVARTLASHGISKGARVGLILSNNPEHIYIFLALARLEAIFIPISIYLKSSGLSYLISNAEPQIIIAETLYSSEVLEVLGNLKSPDHVLWLGSSAPIGPRHKLVDELLSMNGPDLPIPSNDLDRDMIISYTSGTTGAPKGALLTERWFQIGAKNAGLCADVQPDDVLFLWEPFYNVAAWMTVGASLQHGVSIGLVDRFSASKCWDQIRQFGATKLHYLGGVVNILLKQPARADDADNPIKIAWGASAPTQSWEEFQKRFGLGLREGYGITEASNFTLVNVDGKRGSIGKDVPEFQSRIEDDKGHELPPNEIGEIVVRPRRAGTIMKCYFRDPERTSEVHRNGAVYTGDLGYRDEEGYFYFKGRKKEGLRRRGQNVSAWEVERVINAHPAVEESAVIGVPSELGDQDLKLFIKVASGQTVDPLEVLQWSSSKLAYYQVPRYVDFIVDFPRGPTHRIRKTLLPTDVSASWDAEKVGFKPDRLR